MFVSHSGLEQDNNIYHSVLRNALIRGLSWEHKTTAAQTCTGWEGADLKTVWGHIIHAKSKAGRYASVWKKKIIKKTDCQQKQGKKFQQAQLMFYPQRYGCDHGRDCERGSGARGSGQHQHYSQRIDLQNTTPMRCCNCDGWGHMGSDCPSAMHNQQQLDPGQSYSLQAPSDLSWIATEKPIRGSWGRSNEFKMRPTQRHKTYHHICTIIMLIAWFVWHLSKQGDKVLHKYMRINKNK